MNIKIVHLLLNPESQADVPDDKWQSTIDKQKQSIDCFEKISHKFKSYTKLWSDVNRTELPKETCANPSIIKEDITGVVGPVLSYGHYGAYKAHRRAATQEFTDELDALIVLESDVVTNLPPQDFYEHVKRAYDFGINHDARLITLADIRYGETGRDITSEIEDHGDFIKIPHFLMGSMYMIFKSEKESIKQKYETTGWMTPDIWLFWNYDRRVNIFGLKNPIASQVPGYSMIDYKFKDE